MRRRDIDKVEDWAGVATIMMTYLACIFLAHEQQSGILGIVCRTDTALRQGGLLSLIDTPKTECSTTFVSTYIASNTLNDQHTHFVDEYAMELYF